MDISTASTVHHWNRIPPAPKAVLLIGTNSTGRTTFTELVSRYVWGQQSPGLDFDNGKYILKDVIATKTIRPETINPRFYKGPGEEPQIIDVPCICFAPETKKWTSLDQRVTLTCMGYGRGEVALVLFVEERSTKTNVNPWKKALASFLEMFNTQILDDSFFNSVVMVISKTSADIKHDVMLKRVDKLRESIDKEDAVTRRLLERIIDNDALLTFHKVTNDKAEEEEVCRNWGKLSKMIGFKLENRHLKDMSWSKQDQQSLKKDLWDTFTKCVEPLIGQFKDALQSETFSQVQFKADVQIPDYQPSEATLAQFKAEVTQAVMVVSNILKVKEIISHKQVKARQLLLAILTSGVFRYDNLLKKSAQYVLERIDIRDASGLDWKFEDQRLSISQADLLRLFKWLVSKDGPPEDLQECQQLVGVMDELKDHIKDLPADCEAFYGECKMSLARLQDPKKALQFLSASLTKEKDPFKQVELVLSAARSMRQLGLDSSAFQLFEMCGSVGDVVGIDLSAEWVNKQVGLRWVEMMREAYLFGEAKRGCYVMGARAGTKRKEWGEVLRRVIEAEKQYFSEDIGTNVLLEGATLGDRLDQAIKIIQQAAAPE